MVKLLVLTAGRSPKATWFIASPKREDLETLRELVQSGAVKPVIDRRYELSQVADALAYLAEGHARGKIVLNL
jgi:NADPH:quinone reductase-like Zn-dependent oxidoreductase